MENFTKKQYINQGKLVYPIQIASIYPSYLGCILLEKVQIAFKQIPAVRWFSFCPCWKVIFPLNSELNLIGSKCSHKNMSNMLLWVSVLGLDSQYSNSLGRMESFQAHTTQETRHTPPEFLVPGPLSTSTTRLWQRPRSTQQTANYHNEKKEEEGREEMLSQSIISGRYQGLTKRTSNEGTERRKKQSTKSS